MLHKTTSYPFFMPSILGHKMKNFGEIIHYVGEISSMQMRILQYYLTKVRLFYDISSLWLLHSVIEKSLQKTGKLANILKRDFS